MNKKSHKPSVKPASGREKQKIDARPTDYRKLTVTAGVLAAICAVGAMIKANVNNELNGRGHTDAALAAEKAPGKFVADEYRPPKEGRILRKKIDPSAGKTVILIPDIHVNYEGADNETAKRGQREQYLILKDLIEKYGKITLAMENLPIGFSVEQLKGNTRANPLVRKLFATEDEAKRKNILGDYAGKVPLPVMDLMTVAYRNEIVPVGTVPGDDKYVDEQEQRIAMEQSMVKIIHDPARYKCTKDSRLSIADVIGNFRNNVRDAETVGCYCKYSRIESRIVKSFEERETNVPVTEASRAIEAPGSFTVLVSGALHAPATVREMEKRGVNYLVVAPGSLIKDLESYVDLQTFDKKAVIMTDFGFPDDKNKTCEKLAK